MDDIRRLISLVFVAGIIYSIFTRALWYRPDVAAMMGGGAPYRAEEFRLGASMGPIVVSLACGLIAYFAYPPDRKKE